VLGPRADESAAARSFVGDRSTVDRPNLVGYGWQGIARLCEAALEKSVHQAEHATRDVAHPNAWSTETVVDR
jgi:hypothetical protein